MRVLGAIRHCAARGGCGGDQCDVIRRKDLLHPREGAVARRNHFLVLTQIGGDALALRASIVPLLDAEIALTIGVVQELILRGRRRALRDLRDTILAIVAQRYRVTAGGAVVRDAAVRIVGKRVADAANRRCEQALGLCVTTDVVT